MLQISQLLDRFKNIKNGEKVKKQLIVDVFNENKIPVNINQVSISKNTLFLKLNPIIKTEALLKKDDVIKQIKKIPIISFISDIK